MIINKNYCFFSLAFKQKNIENDDDINQYFAKISFSFEYADDDDEQNEIFRCHAIFDEMYFKTLCFIFTFSSVSFYVFEKKE